MRLSVPRALLAAEVPSGSLCPAQLYEIFPVVQDRGLTKRRWNWQEQLSRFERLWMQARREGPVTGVPSLLSLLWHCMGFRLTPVLRVQKRRWGDPACASWDVQTPKMATCIAGHVHSHWSSGLCTESAKMRVGAKVENLDSSIGTSPGPAGASPCTHPSGTMSRPDVKDRGCVGNFLASPGC